MEHVRPDGQGPGYFGLYPAIVTNIVDDDKLGRIQVKFPWLGTDGADVRAWATLCTPYADDKQGFFAMPAVDTQVVVGFEAGDLRRPYIVGSCWNGKEKQPSTPERQNNKRLIKTRSESLLEFDDTSGAVKITLKTKAGFRLVFDESANELTLRHKNGCYVKMDSSGKVTIKANQSVEVQAPQLNVHSGTATFDGLINCKTLNAQVAVMSPVYRPGAGNKW